MKKKHCIIWLLIGAAAIFLITLSTVAAADKVVVIPLESGSGDTGRVRTVTSATGRIWMDRNLGAHRVAIKSDDPQAYGSLYQWGRLGDGHEYRESPVTDTLSPTNVPGHGHFIQVNASPFDWTAMPNNDLWLEASSINNPCPAGFRVPTEPEWETERASWSSNDSAGAFASPLKLVVAGFRVFSDGTVYNAGSNGHYWSRTASSNIARLLNFYSDFAGVGLSGRSNGFSVRCIKD